MTKAEAVFEKIAVSSSAQNWAAKYTPEQIELWAERPSKDPRPEPQPWNTQMAINRAERWSDSGPKKLIKDPELMKEMFKKTMIGAGIGALGGLGTAELALLATGNRGAKLAPIGRVLGAILGAHAGQMHGEVKSRGDWLKERGFFPDTTMQKTNPSSYQGMTPEAKLMYLHPKFKGGGYAVDV